MGFLLVDIITSFILFSLTLKIPFELFVGITKRTKKNVKPNISCLIYIQSGAGITAINENTDNKTSIVRIGIILKRRKKT